MNLVKGIITPMVTPVRNGLINEEDVKELLNFLKEIGVSGIFPMGSTGLFSFFSLQNHKKMLEFAIKNKPANVAAYAGVSRNNFDETSEMIKAAKDLGYDAAVVVVPFYFKLSQGSIHAYFDKIAKTDISIIIYNIPQFTGNVITAETVKNLVNEHSNINGIKDSSGDMRSFQTFISELPDDFFVYQGQDDLLLPSLSVGAAGGVCGTSNFSGKIVEVYRERSVKAHEEIVRIMKTFSSFEFPKPYYYLFRKMVLKEENPDNYMPFPLNDLDKNDERVLDEVVRI
ncbi:MAG: dihydrodipicolinate synthase family protein [Nitrososphaeria archaeon]